MRVIDTEILTDYFVEHDLAFEYAIQHQDRKELERLIADIPTAYDPDKVVKEINEWTFNANIDVGDGTVMNHNLIVRDTAIEIVKGGGVDE